MDNFTEIPGFSSMYFIDQSGKIYSKYKHCVLKRHNNGIGYFQVWLKDGPEHRGKWHKIHRLVLTTFGPLPPTVKHTDVNHLDGNKANNHISNLQWVTKSENTKHAFKTGLLKPNFAAKGRSVSEKTRLKQSIAKLGRSHSRWAGTYVTPEGKFDSITRAAQAHNTYPNKIRRKCLKGSERGWYFVPKPE